MSLKVYMISLETTCIKNLIIVESISANLIYTCNYSFNYANVVFFPFFLFIISLSLGMLMDILNSLLVKSFSKILNRLMWIDKCNLLRPRQNWFIDHEPINFLNVIQSMTQGTNDKYRKWLLETFISDVM